jgi:multiple sugar transport system permease protein
VAVLANLLNLLGVSPFTQQIVKGLIIIGAVLFERIYHVTDTEGIAYEWALIRKGRQASEFIDPTQPELGLITWEGNWRQLSPVYHSDPQWSNFREAWDTIDFPLLFGNTLFIAVTGATGTLLASISVAYAFARFPLPFKNTLFIILISTIILPAQVTLIPTYTFLHELAGLTTMAGCR